MQVGGSHLRGHSSLAVVKNNNSSLAAILIIIIIIKRICVAYYTENHSALNYMNDKTLYPSRAQCLHARTDINNLETLTQHNAVHLNAVFTVIHLRYGGGGRTRLPKFKFSAKFPIGLHVILQIQIRKFENDCYMM